MTEIGGESFAAELEEASCAIWEELFGIGGIGIDDDFFALGGHSLLATVANLTESALVSAQAMIR